MAGRGQKSNFDNEIKSSIAQSDARAKSKGLREGSKAEEAQESPSEERAEVRAGRDGAPARTGATRVAAQGNPQNTAHLQGGNMQPGAQMHQAPLQQPHMSGVGGMENDPVIHASSIAHAILQRGGGGPPPTMHTPAPPPGDTQRTPGTSLHGMRSA